MPIPSEEDKKEAARAQEEVSRETGMAAGFRKPLDPRDASDSEKDEPEPAHAEQAPEATSTGGSHKACCEEKDALEDASRPEDSDVESAVGPRGGLRGVHPVVL